jgi:hypothetical protein
VLWWVQINDERVNTTCTFLLGLSWRVFEISHKS